MFPAYKPTDIPNLPTKYYRKLLDYYTGVKRAEIKAMGVDPDLEVPGFQVVDFDKSIAQGRPI